MSRLVLDGMPVQMQFFNDTISGIARLLVQVKLFPKGHPSIDLSLGKSYSSLKNMMKGEQDLVFRIVMDSICYMNFKIDLDDGADKNLKILGNTFRQMSIGELVFHHDINEDELLALMEISASVLRGDRKFDFNEAWRRISNIKIRHGNDTGMINLRSAVEKCGGTDTCRDFSGSSNIEGRTRIGQEIGSVLGKLEKIQASDGKSAGKMILRLIEAEGDGNILVLFLRSLKSYDDYTFRHSINVAVISSAIARHVGLDESSSGRVGLAAIMHDIGKLYVPKSVIHKAGRLSPSEWQLIRKHPVDGARILREEKVDDLISRVAYEHHMRFDGKGYPPARATEKIHDASHIVRIADSYDALTTKRAYRKQISPYEAIKLMTRTRGSEFHPEYFDVFLHMMGNIPIGSMLELRTGEKVLVVDIRGDGGFLPRVRLLTDADGNEIKDERIIDLNETDPVTRECRYSIKSIEDSALRNLDIGQYLVHCV